MNLELGFAIVALLVAGYGLVATLLARYSVSAAFSFVVIGAVLGGAGLGLLTNPVESADLGLLVEGTLALVLFSDASTINLRKLTRDASTVLRLLAIGLPLTIIAGTLLAMGLFPGIGLGVALLIAATLAPTDAALGQAVITDKSVPARIRRILNVESGLNDGIVAPIVAVAIAIAIAEGSGASQPVLEAMRELIIAGVVGVAVGFAGGWLLVRADERKWTSHGSRGLAVLSMAVGAYLLAVSVDSSGFIAAFFAGLAFNAGSRRRAESAVHFTESISALLSIGVWLIFGLIVFEDYLIGGIDVGVVLFAVLSLTVLRMIPVALALLGERFQWATVAFTGWFGPRGLASIVFAMMGIESLEKAGVSTGPLLPVVAWTVFLSIVLHGFSARPLASWYGKFASRLPESSPELQDSDEQPHAKAGVLWSMHPTEHGSEPPRGNGS
jgi:NhaP-type Na+/H+ or K+/H+ antiporter